MTRANHNLSNKLRSIAVSRFVLLSFLWLNVPASLAQRSEVLQDPNLEVLSLEGPKEKDVLAMAVGDGAAWILTNDRLLRVDGLTGQLLSMPTLRVKTWSFDFSNAVIAAHSLWVTGKANKIVGVHRIELSTGKLLSSIPLPYPQGPAVGDNGVWVFAGARHDKLFRINPQTNTTSLAIELGRGFGSAQFADGSLWVINEENGRVKRIDLASAKVLEEFSVSTPHENGPLARSMYYFAVSDGSLWVHDVSGDETVLTRIDANTHQRVAKLQVANSYFVPILWNGFVWLATDGVLNLTKIDPRTNHIVGQVALPVSRGMTVPLLLRDGDSLWAVRKGRWSYTPITIQRVQLRPGKSQVDETRR
jgi:hypothetical protein